MKRLSILIFIIFSIFSVSILAKPLNVAIVWHQHQPDYRDGQIYEAPWVRLHSIKDYLDMITIISEYPQVRLNVNLVPSLMAQIDDYVFNNAKDRFLILMQKDPESLTLEEKTFILERSFDISWENVIKKYPYYYSLLEKRGLSGEVDKTTLDRFVSEEYRDLLVWFNLAWFDPDFHPELSYFFMKERHFSASDCDFLIGFQKKIMSEIIPTHRKMASQGRIELTTTPYYHPILPLIYNSSIASESFHGIKLPREFSFAGDAYIHVKKGLEAFRERFGYYPAGMWPAEGSVSKEVIPVFAQNGIKYIMTDEEVLSKSLGIPFERDESGNLLEPELLYRPYKASHLNNDIYMVFRDRTLSDRIGFDYSKMSPEKAVEDMRLYLDGISKKLDPDKDYLVCIILDGENAWENYKDDGKSFFHKMYSMFNQSSDFKLVTLERYISQSDNVGKIDRLWPGSWIGADFTTWIGEDEENTAWNYLLQAREMFRNKMPILTQQEKLQAFELILKAEGSDWFWWFGKDQESANDLFFDRMFRKTLARVYEICKEKVPEYLDIPIIESQDKNEKKATLYFKPQIDGNMEDNWKKAYSVYSMDNSGVMKKGPLGISSLYVTTWEDELYFFAEFEKDIDINKVYAYIDGNYTELSKISSSIKGRSIEGKINSRVKRFAFAIMENDKLISRLPEKKDIVPSYEIRHKLKKIADFKDATGDDFGNGNITYPGNKVFKGNMFDLEKMQIFQDNQSYYFFITLGNMENVWNSPIGLSTQTVDIYIGKNSGELTPLLPGRESKSRGIWDYAISVEGWKQVIYKRENDSIIEMSGVECIKDEITDEIIVKVDRKYFSEDISDSGFIVTVCGQDGMSQTRIRKVSFDKTEWSFGGGKQGGSNIIDILDRGNQKKQLDDNILEFIR